MYKDQPLSLQQMLPRWLSPDDFYVVSVGAVALVAVVAVGISFLQRDTYGKRIRQLQERRAELRGEVVRSRRRRRPQAGSMNVMRQVVSRLQLLKSSQVAQVQSMLIEAGMRSKDAIVIYSFFSFILPIVLCLAGLISLGTDFWGTGTLAKFKFVAPIAGAYLGLKLPYMFVARARKKRYILLQRALADTLDLMTICAEAGLTLTVTLERVSRELGLAYPEMAQELSLTAMEMGFLPDRNKALLNLSERVKLAEIRGIASVLMQTEKYGTPIAQALRVLSAEFREQRMLRAENKAAKLPAMLTVPMICFILPTLFIVIIAPAVVKIMNTM